MLFIFYVNLYYLKIVYDSKIDLKNEECLVNFGNAVNIYL